MKSCSQNTSVMVGLLAGTILLFTLLARGAGGSNDFVGGVEAYEQNNFALAAKLFATEATNRPSLGALLNLGNAQWQQGRTAEAIIAWERAERIDPFAVEAENNLKFARDLAQLEAPDLTWCEVAAGWLPANWWATLATASLWFAVGTVMVPVVLRRRRSATQQALVALGLGVFLFTLPANYGVWTRANLGFVLVGETPLRLTPTLEAEAVTRLAAGEPGRVIQERGKYLLLQTRRFQGWVAREQFELVLPK